MALLQFEIVQKEKAATDAIIIHLKETNNNPVHYEAGQFLTFIIHHYGRELRRSYSICSCPGVDDHLAVVIKRQTNGEVSRYIIDNLNVGDIITALAPAGRFTISSTLSAERTIYFIAAGSGISPVFSLLKKVVYFQPSTHVKLIYQNRDEDSIIFKKELNVLAQKFGNRFQLISLLSNPGDSASRPKRLNNNLLEQLLRTDENFSATESLFYICGPRAFMRMCKFVLKLLGTPEEHIRQEEFVIDFFPAPPFMTDHSPKNITVNWNGTSHKFTVSYPTNLLQGALDHNIQLPYSCRGGRCSTCTAKCISGKIKMSINEVLTAKDLEEGLVLPCVGYAETDVVIEL